MPDALIGHSGFVGQTLLRQRHFDARYRSVDIGAIDGLSFDMVVCAGAPAQKWMANRDPSADRANIEMLIDNLRAVRCDTFVLISTVDVFNEAHGVDERAMPTSAGLQPYGENRLRLEEFARTSFPRHLIVRLPGLVGPGLRKNVVFDLHNSHNLHMIDSRDVFQFYPMVNLWGDVRIALAAGLECVHLTSEPISVAEVAKEGFDRVFENALSRAPAYYDMRSVHARLFGGAAGYQYSRRESLMAIRAYAQSEPLSGSAFAGTAQ